MIGPGDTAPPFSLRDQERQVVSLDDHRGRPSLVIFMPFAFTRVCGGEMCEIRDNLSSIEQAGASAVVITCDNAPTNKAWAESEGFSFPILSDFWPHGEVTKAYGTFNETTGAADRSTFVLDEETIVREVVRSDGLREPRPFDAYRRALAAL